MRAVKVILSIKLFRITVNFAWNIFLKAFEKKKFLIFCTCCWAESVLVLPNLRSLKPEKRAEIAEFYNELFFFLFFVLKRTP